MYSVVIITYKRPNYLKRLLDSIEAPEIIVVNMDSETEEINKLCDKHNIRQIHVEGNPVAKGINIGILSAKFNYVIICNDDIELSSKQEFNKLYETYIKAGISILSPRINENNDSDEIRSFYEQEFYYPNTNKSTTQERSLLGRIFACLMLSKKVFYNIGLLDEQFWFYYDDMDYLRRALLKGHKFAFWNGSSITHFAAREHRSAPPDNLTEYYKLKWGGNCGNEQYKLPFNLDVTYLKN